MMGRVWLGFVLLLALSGCSSTPPEVVELSYKMGDDIQSVGVAYKTLVKTHFDALRKQRLDYLENVWKPSFVEKWLKKGRLVEMAQSKVRWDFDNTNFAAPTPGKEKQQLLASVTEWSTVAVEQIEKKRHELIDPLDKSESQLLGEIDTDFNRIGRANSLITAHLNSLRKVDKIQEKYLQELGVKDFRDTLLAKMREASEQAELGLERIKKADGLLKQ